MRRALSGRLILAESSMTLKVQGSGWRVQGGGAAHKNMEAPRTIHYTAGRGCGIWEP